MCIMARCLDFDIRWNSLVLPNSTLLVVSALLVPGTPVSYCSRNGVFYGRGIR